MLKFTIVHHVDQIMIPAELVFYFLLFLFGIVLLAFLIAPVGSNALLGYSVHLLGTDLHFEDVAVIIKGGRMQGLIHVELRHGDVVL